MAQKEVDYAGMIDASYKVVDECIKALEHRLEKVELALTQHKRDPHTHKV